MGTMINGLSEIGEAAGTAAGETNVRKEAFVEEMEDRTVSLDADLEQETACRIAKIQHKMEAGMGDMLARQKADFEALLKQLEGNHNQHHAAYVETLFQNMIKG